MENWAILELYCGESGKLGFYNSQELGLARALVPKGICPMIVYPVKGIKAVEEQKIEEEITILRVPCRAVGIHAFYNLNFLLEKNIDVVHLDSDNQMYAPAVMKFCAKNGIRFYNYVGTLYSDTGNFLKKKLMNLISARNMRYLKKYQTIAKTEAVGRELIQNGANHVRVIPVGLDVTQIKRTEESKEQLRGTLGLPLDRTILLFVGRQETYKRPFAALELLNKLGENYFLVLIGDGSLREEMAEQIRRQGLEKRVMWKKQIKNVEMFRYYCAADYYVNFNIHEIFGMSILEAMYQEGIVVARRAPGPEEIIEDGISGFLCDSDEDMCRVIGENATENIGRQARERVLSQFTWTKSAEHLLEAARNE